MSYTEQTDLIHKGLAYSVTGATTLEDNGDSFIFTSVPGANDIHFLDMDVFSSGGNVLIEFIENVTIIVPGQAFVPNNRKRDCARPSTMKVYAGSTVSGGQVLYSKTLYGDLNGIHMNSSEGLIRGEWILNKKMPYAIRVTNQTSPSASINISADMLYLESNL